MIKLGVKDITEERRKMVEMLMKEKLLVSEDVINAMMKVPREEFVWRGTEYAAYYDTPQPLGSTGQTISAPHMIAIMLEEMELKPGHKVLEIGTGSGYNAALMAELVAPSSNEFDRRGHVITVERIDELMEFASENLKRASYSDRVTVCGGDGTLGYPEKENKEIYDRIVVTAAAPRIPRYLMLQLKQGGVLLIPVGDTFVQTLKKITKKKVATMTKNICECMFVPLIGEDGYH